MPMKKRANPFSLPLGVIALWWHSSRVVDLGDAGCECRVQHIERSHQRRPFLWRDGAQQVGDVGGQLGTRRIETSEPIGVSRT